MKKIFYFLVLLVIVSCSQQRVLRKTYVGKPVDVLSAKYGNPKVVLDHKDEKVYVYEIVKDLKSTEISQAKLTLDPVVSPMVQKTERYYFTIKEGKITNARIEEEYDR
jgi:hypothetical protein